MKRRIVIPILLLMAAVVIGLHLKMNAQTPASGRTGAESGKVQSPEVSTPMVAVTILPPETKTRAPKEVKAEKEAKAPKEKQTRSVKPVKTTGQISGKSQAEKGIKEDEGSGEPNLYAQYELAISDYLYFMRSRGARVLVFDLAGNKPVCEVDGSGNLYQPGGTDGFSTNTRRITDDYPGAEQLLRKVEQKFGKGGFEILLLLPESMVNRLNGQLKQIVNELGLSFKDITTIFLAYRGSRSSVSVYVDRVAASGSTKRIGASFKL